MYEDFFGLTDRPFAPAPLAKRYFAAGPAEAARQTLARCIDRGEGIGILIGPAGTGKTLVCQVLAEQFRARFSIALLSSGRIGTQRNLFQAIMFELGLPYRGMEDGELRLALTDHLVNKDTLNGGLLLLIDEAHSLPLRLLEEVRLLTNLLRNGQPRVRLVLSGGAALEERLASPKLESFNQRIAGRCFLQAFCHDDTLAYIRSQIVNAGGQVEQIFTADALQAVHRATDGIPRLVNQVCDHALILAYAGGVKPIAQPGIEEAWSDLQQLPTPWNAATGAVEQAPDIIDFGALEEDVIPLKPLLEQPAAPRLHAISAAEENDLFQGEPSARIERIEAKLETIDAEYQPAAAAEPEVELVFSTASDPFAEDFEEEEVVVDRFAEMDGNVLANRPLVHSAEGREISALLEPMSPASDADSTDSSPAGPDLSLASLQEESEAVWDTMGFDRQAVDDTFEDVDRDEAVPLNPADDPVLPEESETISIMIGEPVAADAAPIEPLESIQPLEAPQFAAAEVPEAAATQAVAADLEALDAEIDSDQDLIIVEDDPPEPTPPAPTPPKARRQEYRQLFARLRRG